MKKNLTLMMGMFFILSVLYLGCNKDESNPVGGGPTITSIKTNGSIVQVSRTQVTGTLFVTDQNNNPIQGITSSNVTAKLSWTILNHPQADSVFGTVTVTPNQGTGKNVAAAITMDYSGSMGPEQIQCMQNGVKTYISKMATNDQTEIIKFDDRVIVAQIFTNNKTLLTQVVDSNYSLGGTTALYQSIYQGLNDVKNFNPAADFIRCVVAFTDGGENASTINRNDMISYALTNGLPVYTVGLYYSPSDTSSYAIWDLKNIADTTGGFFFGSLADSTCTSNLTNIYSKISGQIAGSYSLNIIWPGANLPPTGTTVKCTITTTYSGHTNSFVKSYTIQ
ncbi:MAG: vWA domain-containing protein [Ignavibacteria bacterium]